MSNKLPVRGFVPVTEVADYSDAISVVNLGLPIGFDDDQLGFNLRAAERFRRCVGFDTIAISTYDGEHDQLHAIPQQSADGTAVAATSASATMANRYRNRINHDGNETFTSQLYGRPSASISLNRTTIDDEVRKISEAEGAVRGVLSPVVRAKALNSVANVAMKAAASSRLFPLPRKVAGAAYYGTITGIAAIQVPGAFESMQTVPYSFAGLAVGYTVGGAFINSVDTMRNYRRDDRLASIGIIVPYDRYLASRALLASTKLFGEIKDNI